MAVGSALRPIGDPSWRSRAIAFQGNGLRPIRSAICVRVRGVGRDRRSWTRRTRIDGDIWGSGDVPLGDAAESYAVQVVVGGQVRRDVQGRFGELVLFRGRQSAARWMARGGFLGPFAQVSDRFGPGPFRDVWVGEGDEANSSGRS